MSLFGGKNKQSGAQKKIEQEQLRVAAQNKAAEAQKAQMQQEDQADAIKRQRFGIGSTILANGLGGNNQTLG